MTPTFLLVQRVSEKAWIPTRAFPDDAGLDLYVVDDVVVKANTFVDLKTGLAVKIADGFWGLIRPRSSTFFKRNLVVHEGTVDPGYTGELNIGVYNPGTEDVMIMCGDRIAQLVVVPLILHAVKVVDKLPNTSRGPNGFGSTGR